MSALTLDLRSVVQLTEAAFVNLCAANPEAKLERTATGELVIMSPTGGETGRRNLSLSMQLGLWNQRTGLGVAFDSSTMFQLPSGAFLSPDAAWVELSRWDALTPEEREGFVPLCPDFVVELRSPSDALKALQNKMAEYRENGTRLGWLIDPKTKQVEIYRPAMPVEVLMTPRTLSGNPVLPDFPLDLSAIFPR
ncbi:MAG: Uma2 family endonuclease [Cyanobacteria bacterium]|nr:Uma2 family endonuclease [Cyanobacteriota bacterium]MDA0867084.1 Uma2 family endonuclease [Cyanobacteriota bacterium]